MVFKRELSYYYLSHIVIYHLCHLLMLYNFQSLVSRFWWFSKESSPTTCSQSTCPPACLLLSHGWVKAIINRQLRGVYFLECLGRHKKSTRFPSGLTVGLFPRELPWVSPRCWPCQHRWTPCPSCPHRWEPFPSCGSTLNAGICPIVHKIETTPKDVLWFSVKEYFISFCKRCWRTLITCEDKKFKVAFIFKRLRASVNRFRQWRTQKR